MQPSAAPSPQTPRDLWPLFDRGVDRSGTASTKWEKYAARPDILPFWVADMDLPTPGFILDAVRDRLEHPVLGYTNVPESLSATFCRWLQRSYRWTVEPSWLTWIGGVVPGLEVATDAVVEPGDPLLLLPPVYYPFLNVPGHSRTRPLTVNLVQTADRDRRWVMDFDAIRHALQRHPCDRRRALLFCNPQNPTGRCYDRSELEALATLAEEQDLIIISDEIHCELLLDRQPHLPIAALDEATAARTVTLFAPSKTYNLPGLSCAVAVIPDPALRRRFRRARRGLVSSPGALAYAAAEAAYGSDGHWLANLQGYLRRNADLLAAAVGARGSPVEATYLSWIDVRDLADRIGTAQLPAYFEGYGLGLSDGAPFGGSGYVRFNFGCSRPLLQTGIERLGAALAEASGKA